MRGQKDLRTMKKGVIKIENQRNLAVLVQMLQKFQMTDFGESYTNFWSNYLWN